MFFFPEPVALYIFLGIRYLDTPFDARTPLGDIYMLTLVGLGTQARWTMRIADVCLEVALWCGGRAILNS